MIAWVPWPPTFFFKRTHKQLVPLMLILSSLYSFLKNLYIIFQKGVDNFETDKAC